MKKIITLVVLLIACFTSFAQDSMEKVMEKRAKEMHRVISLNDKEQWKKFVKENYTQTLIDKPMQAKVQTSDNGNTSTSSTEAKAVDNLEAKAGMFQRLHNDFGGSKIVSFKPTGEKMEMVLKNDMGMMRTFNLKFEKNSPYKIDGLGIEVGDVRRGRYSQPDRLKLK